MNTCCPMKGSQHRQDVSPSARNPARQGLHRRRSWHDFACCFPWPELENLVRPWQSCLAEASHPFSRPRLVHAPQLGRCDRGADLVTVLRSSRGDERPLCVALAHRSLVPMCDRYCVAGNPRINSSLAVTTKDLGFDVRAWPQLAALLRSPWPKDRDFARLHLIRGPVERQVFGSSIAAPPTR